MPTCHKMILNIGRVQGTARPWFFIEIDGIRMARDAFQRRPRNALRDAITNIANVSIFKEVKLHEHVSFYLPHHDVERAEPSQLCDRGSFLTDAGLTGAQQGFGRLELTNDNLPGTNDAGG